MVGGMPGRGKASEDGCRSLNENSHTQTRTKNKNFRGLYSKILYIGDPSSFYTNHHFSLLGEKSCFPRNPPSITLSPQHLLGLDASLLDHDQGVEIHCPLLPGVWWRFRLSPQNWQEVRLRLGTTDTDAHNDGDTGLESILLELANWRDGSTGQLCTVVWPEVSVHKAHN